MHRFKELLWYVLNVHVYSLRIFFIRRLRQLWQRTPRLIVVLQLQAQLKRFERETLLDRSSAPRQKRSDALFIDRDRRSLRCPTSPFLLFQPFYSSSFTRLQEIFSQRLDSLSFFFNLHDNETTQINLINFHRHHLNNTKFLFIFAFLRKTL